jgi:hypothetical protein
MKSPSSTSNSKLPRGALLALLLLLAVELGLARQERLWSWVPASNSGVVDAIERQVITPAQAPQVLLMGSSRVRDGVAPRQLEAALHLPEGAVLNLGLTRGTPWDAALLYRRNRDKLKQARLLVVGVEDWSFNAAVSPNERYRRFASLSDRVGVYNPDWTRSLVVGWIWRTYDAQGPLRNLLTSALKGRPKDLPIAPDGRVQWRKKESDTGPKDLDLSLDVERAFRKFEVTDGLNDQLRDLIALAREDGLTVVLVQVPLRDAYIDLAAQKYPDALARYRDNLRHFSDTPQLIYERASDLGISPEWYYDYGHLTAPGARVFTDRLAADLRPLLPR